MHKYQYIYKYSSIYIVFITIYIHSLCLEPHIFIIPLELQERSPLKPLASASASAEPAEPALPGEAEPIIELVKETKEDDAAKEETWIMMDHGIMDGYLYLIYKYYIC